MDGIIQGLKELPAGQRLGLPYELIDDLFPPGIEDDRVKETMLAFAKANGCSIENRPEERAVYLVKGV